MTVSAMLPLYGRCASDRASVMSALGTKRTCANALQCPLSGVKRTCLVACTCPLLTQSGHCAQDFDAVPHSTARVRRARGIMRNLVKTPRGRS